MTRSTRLLVLSVVAWAAVAAPASAAAAPPRFNLLGTIGDPAGDHSTISAMDMATGEFSGHATIQGRGFSVAGTESGDTAHFDLTQDGGTGYVSHNTHSYSILADGNVGGPGEFTDTVGHHQAYQDEIDYPAGTTPTTTTLTCDAVSCTATVSGAGGTPTGRLTVIAATGSVGGGGSCELAAGACTVPYQPGADGTPNAVGVYSGDASFHVSQGQAGTKRLSETTVSCTYKASTQTAACTARVRDASGRSPAIAPTGTVAFTADSGGFPMGSTCTLLASDDSPGAAACAQTVTYGGSVSSGSAPPVSGSYGGDAGLGPSSGRNQDIYTAPPDGIVVPDVVDPVEPGTIDQCPAPASPHDSTPSPQPPSGVSAPPGPVTQSKAANAYCPYKAGWASSEKSAAKQWGDYYTLKAVQASRKAAAAASAAGPGPKSAQDVFAVGAGIVGFSAADYEVMAGMELTVFQDPPDPLWRVAASAATVHSSALPTLAGASGRDNTALRAYAKAALRDAADRACVTDAINRASTALANHDVPASRKQYLAGAACARDAVRQAASIPKLGARAGDVLAKALRRVPTAQRARRIAVARRWASTANGRAAAARRVVATIRRAVALPGAVQGALTRSLAARTRIASRPSMSLDTRTLPQSGVLAKQTAEVLTFAANASPVGR